MAGPGPNRFYSSTAVQTTINQAGGISSSALGMTVSATTGFPSQFPFVLSIDQNTASEELVLVSANASGSLTMSRGFNGTTAVSHNNGASVVHVMCAQDLTEPQAHLGANDAVHGLSVGSLVVGTTDTQTLTNKTLTSPSINSPSISAATLTGTTNAAIIEATGEVGAADHKTTGLTGATSVSRLVGGTNGGAPVTGTFAVGDVVVDVSNGTLLVCVSNGSPGGWSTLANLSSNQTLSSKILASPQWTGTMSGTSISATGQIQAADYSNTGLTGATTTSRYVGATGGGPPTTGTFNTGDWVVDTLNINIWVCTTGGTPGTWFAYGVQLLPGAGSSTNVVTGGANRSGSQMPFIYSTQASITVGAGSAWSSTTSGTHFNGVGNFHVTPGNNAGNLGYLTIIPANCNITSGNLTLAGAAINTSSSGVAASTNILVNITAFGW